MEIAAIIKVVIQKDLLRELSKSLRIKKTKRADGSQKSTVYEIKYTGIR